MCLAARIVLVLVVECAHCRRQGCQSVHLNKAHKRGQGVDAAKAAEAVARAGLRVENGLRVD